MGLALRLVLRTTLAGLITFALGHVLKLPQAYWAVLTSVIVVQGSVATSLKAGADRMLGTVAGAVWGVILTLLIPHHGPVASRSWSASSAWRSRSSRWPFTSPTWPSGSPSARPLGPPPRPPPARAP